MTLLDYSNLNYSYYLPDQFTSFDPPKQDTYYSYDNDFVPLEPEFLCFDPLPPTLFDFEVVDFTVPHFNPPFFNPPVQLPYYPLELPTEDTSYYYPAAFPENRGLCGSRGVVKKTVSAQSKAARERRRKITEKTHALGKLVPGATNMNTAQMFQAASKYVLFLQAQLAILNTVQDLPKESKKEVNLNDLSILRSPIIQEKLYAKEKCLVPMELLALLQKHLDFEYNPSILKQIKELMHHYY